MSHVFHTYHRHYCDLSADLARKCTSAALLSAEEKKQKLADLKTGLDEADSLIRKMDLEARSLQPTEKALLLTKLREYKSDLNKLKGEVKKSATMQDSVVDRDELLESGLSDSLAASEDQRQRLLISTERLNQTSDRIKDSKRTLLETEELGVTILQDLYQQRQSLLHSHETLNAIDDNVGRSKRILISMSRRMSRNKYITGGLIAVLIVVIMLITYAKITHSN